MHHVCRWKWWAKRRRVRSAGLWQLDDGEPRYLTWRHWSITPDQYWPARRSLLIRQGLYWMLIENSSCRFASWCMHAICCMQKLVQLDTPTDTQLYSLLSSRILTHILALLRHILHCRRDRLLYGICRSSHNRTWYYCRHARADWSGSIANLLYTHAQSAKGLWEYSNFGEIIFISHFNASNYLYIAQIYASFVHKNERHLLHI